MAHDGGHIFTSSHSGVNILDVLATLNTTEKDVGKLCKHININSWAKYKPVSFPGINVFHIPNGGAPISSGFDMYALEDDPINIINNPDLHLSYTKPSGGLLSPYRLSDFNGYYHRAVCPLLFTFDSTVETDDIVTPVLTIDDSINGFDANKNLALKDIYDLSSYGDYRLTAAIVNLPFTGDSPEWEEATPIRYFYSIDKWVEPTLDAKQVTCYFNSLNLNSGTKYGIVMMLTDTDEYVREGTATCSNNAVHLLLIDGGDRAIFQATSPESSTILRFDITINNMEMSWEHSYTLQGSIGNNYSEYYVNVSDVKISLRNGMSMTTDHTISAQTSMKVVLNLSSCLARTSEGTVNETPGFSERNFDLTDWIYFDGNSNTFELDNNGALIVNIPSSSFDRYFIEEPVNSGTITVRVQVWFKGASNVSSVVGGTEFTLSPPNDSYRITDGVGSHYISS